eukprot:Platyproteum_vivax@DN5731_c0_g1_i5.p1
MVSKSLSIRVLDLANYLDLEAKDLAEMGRIPQFPIHLQKVSFRNNWKITDLALSLFLRRCAQLHSVDVLGCGGLTDAWMAGIRQRNQPVKHLALGIIGNSKSVAKYSNPLPFLVGMDAPYRLSKPPPATAASPQPDVSLSFGGVKFGVQSETPSTAASPVSQSPDLQPTKMVTENSVVLSGFKGDLETIVLANIPNMNRPLPLTQFAHSLTHLDIRGATGLRDAEVTGVSSLINLKTLVLAGCTQLTYAAISPSK